MVARCCRFCKFNDSAKTSEPAGQQWATISHESSLVSRYWLAITEEQENSASLHPSLSPVVISRTAGRHPRCPNRSWDFDPAAKIGYPKYTSKYSDVFAEYNYDGANV